ncbi:MAG: Lrp/AsnC family transcriptional regulator [Actinobacteria bacterium]|nr:Lrp/AsnC family transcriptional regulator [Actinomycetota bacterium]
MAERFDDVDRAILGELQADGRVSFSELGRRVGLSAPAVTERVRRLEAQGIITGYRAVVDLEAVGLPIEAIVRVRDNSGRIEKVLGDHPEVLEARHVTGEDCWVIRVAVAAMRDLETIVGRFGKYGPTTTSLVFSTPISDRPVVPPT